MAKRKSEYLGVETKIRGRKGKYAQIVYMRGFPMSKKWVGFGKPMLMSLSKLGKGDDPQGKNGCYPPFKHWKVDLKL